MGRSDTTKIIIENAPKVLDLVGNLIRWISALYVAVDEQDQNHGTFDQANQKSQNGSKFKRVERSKQSNSVGDASYEILQNDCQTKANSHFQTRFGYPYMGDRSRPTQKVGPQISSSEDFFNAQANNPGVVVKAVISSLDATTPDWVQADMPSDIAARINAYLAAPPTNAFIEKAFTIDYLKPDKSVNYQVDLCWIYCTTLAPDPVNPGQNVNTIFLYSLGVAYEAMPWKQRLEPNLGSPKTWPIVRISFAFTTAVMGSALAAFIYSAKDKPTTIYTTWNVNSNGYSGELTITTKDQPTLLPGGSLDIPYLWALNALKIAGVTQTTINQGVATTSEAAEFEYLAEWSAS